MIELPKGPREAKSVNPNTLLIYSAPKSGKTTICAQLPDSLVLELEPNGGDFVSGNFIDIDGPKMLNEVIDSIKKNGKPYKYLIIDTLTKLDEWSEIVGTFNYMKTNQGKKFNRENEDPNGKIISYTDPRFETVHSLPNGNGYQHSRAVVLNWYEELRSLADHVIFLAHIKDKLIESKIGDTVETIDIALTGKLGKIISTRVDAVGYFTRSGKDGIINFSNDSKAAVGGRCKHLNGKIVISSRKEDGEIETFWDKIYLK